MLQVVADLQTSERGKEILRQAKQAVEALEQSAKVIGDTQAYRHVSSTAKAVSGELDKLADVRMYSRPGFFFFAYKNLLICDNLRTT